jgi:hypothetical protein
MNIDWSQLITKAMKDAEAAAILRAQQVLVEDAWRVAELVVIADQLIAIEDGDPAALPGTETQWRAYRTQVRAWKEGALYFPDAAHRPVRPT